MTRWDAARAASQRTPRRYRECGPVGRKQALDVTLDDGDVYSCRDCGHHLCSCLALVPPPYGTTHEDVEIRYNQYAKRGDCAYVPHLNRIMVGLLTQKQLDNVRAISVKPKRQEPTPKLGHLDTIDAPLVSRHSGGILISRPPHHGIECACVQCRRQFTYPEPKT